MCIRNNNNSHYTRCPWSHAVGQVVYLSRDRKIYGCSVVHFEGRKVHELSDDVAYSYFTEYVARRWCSTAMLCCHESKSWPDFVEPSKVCFLPKTVNLL